MRLYKKAAVCLLAAAMALSMMTACGPTGGGSTGSGNDPDSGTVEPGPEEPEQPEQPEPEEPETPKVTWETSRTKNYYEGISKDNFRISWIREGSRSAYFVQGEKQLIGQQVENAGIMFFYTTGNDDLYVTGLAQSNDPIVISKLTGWTTFEELNEGSGASTDDIAKQKEKILQGMDSMHDMWYIAGNVNPLSFKADECTENGAEFYREVLGSVVTNGSSHVYQYLFTKNAIPSTNGDVSYQPGDLYLVKIDSTTFTVLNQLSACKEQDIPNLDA